MSRLDYVTIAIVAVCVAALVYLIYMTTNLLGDSGDSGTTAQATAPATSGEDAGEDTYTFNDGSRTEDSDEAGSQADAGYDNTSGYDYQNGENLDKGQAPAGGSTTTASPGEMDTESSRVAEDEYTSRGGATTSSGSSSSAASSGQFMVMAGTFTVKAYAQDMEKKLRGLGYNNVVLEPFDRGKFTVVMVDRFNSISEAQSLVRELKGKGVDSYVKRK